MTKRDDGYYWVMAKTDGIGLVIARYDGSDWRVPGAIRGLPDGRVEVLSERIRFPASELAELLVGVVLKTVRAQPMEGDNAELDFDRDELVARFEAILRQGPKS